MGNATPLAQSLWVGISGHFDSLSQVLSEFLDNSISNIVSTNSTNRSIFINIDKLNDFYKISIEDAGTGILDFDSVLKLGDTTLKQSPLNEHGFGLKHALATANPTNDNWRICTRTEDDFQNNIFREVTANYIFDYVENTKEISYYPWPGIHQRTGTYIEFLCNGTLFNTLRQGISGNAGFEKCLKYLNQDLGYVYAGMLSQNAINIFLRSNSIFYNQQVLPIEPKWVDYYQKPRPGSINKDLGSGNVKIDFAFGEMDESPSFRYYKRNMSSSGIEIRINGRVLMNNLFKEIWNLENHPSYNHFLGIINIISQDSSKLPKTRTSKNGIRSDDEKLHNLYEWIRNVFPKPEKKLTNSISEREFVKKLADLKEKHCRSEDKRIDTDFFVFTRIESPVAVDLYYFDGTDVVLYEAKKNTANVQDFYQLLMYWDGLVSDGQKPTEGILLAPNFSPGVNNIITYYNEKKDAEGDLYNFSTKTWHDEGIQYP